MENSYKNIHASRYKLNENLYIVRDVNLGCSKWRCTKVFRFCSNISDRKRANAEITELIVWNVGTWCRSGIVTNRTTQKIRTAPLIHQGIPLLSVPIPSFLSIDTIILRSVIESRDTHRLRLRRIKLRNTLDRIK